MRFFLSLISALQLLKYANEGFLTRPQTLSPIKESNQINGRRHASIAIIGAGFAGLSAYHRLVELGADNDVQLFEASQRIGGRVYPLAFEGIFLQQGAEFINGRNNSIYEMANRLQLITGEMDDGALISEEAIFAAKPGCQVPPDKMAAFSEFVEELELNYAKMARAYPQRWNLTIAEIFERDYVEFLKSIKATNGEAKEQFDSLARMYRGYYEGEWSAPFERLALHNYAQWRDGTQSFPFGSFTLDSRGYASILEELRRGIPMEKLHLGSRVVNIDYREPEIRLSVRSADSDEEWPNRFDFVIVTVPIGHLKTFASSMFTPQLPTHKMMAIEAIGFGAMQKVFLVYQRPFWDANMSSLVALSCPNREQADLVKESLHTLQPHPWAPDRILVAWLSGNGPKFVNGLSDQELAVILTEHLRELLPLAQIDMPEQILRTKWLDDDFFLGSYTFITPEASQLSADPFSLLAEPIYRKEGSGRPPRVMFAGEGTHSQMFQTTIGAVLSGRREAERVARHLANEKC